MCDSQILFVELSEEAEDFAQSCFLLTRQECVYKHGSFFKSTF